MRREPAGQPMPASRCRPADAGQPVPARSSSRATARGTRRDRAGYLGGLHSAPTRSLHMQQRGAERALDALSFFVSDARYGLGAYLGVYLMTEHAWDAGSIGAALSIGGLTGLASQTPLGALVDAVRAKRALIAGAVVMVTATCLVIPLAPQFWSVAAAGLIGALAGVTIGPTLAAIALGIVGPVRFARRAGRNEALFHLGDGFLSLVILLAAPFLGSPVLFWTMAFTALASVAAAAGVPAHAIDHEVARGLLPGAGADEARPS